MNLNKNIEIIAPDLWGVNIEYIKLGYLDELKSAPDAPLQQINLTNSGRIILDKNCKSYMGLKIFFVKAMALSDKELEKEFNYTLTRQDDKGIDLWHNILGFEVKRRKIKKEYTAKDKTCKFDIIKKFFRKWVK